MEVNTKIDAIHKTGWSGTGSNVENPISFYNHAE